MILIVWFRPLLCFWFYYHSSRSQASVSASICFCFVSCLRIVHNSYELALLVAKSCFCFASFSSFFLRFESEKRGYIASFSVPSFHCIRKRKQKRKRGISSNLKNHGNLAAKNTTPGNISKPRRNHSKIRIPSIVSEIESCEIGA